MGKQTKRPRNGEAQTKRPGAATTKANEMLQNSAPNPNNPASRPKEGRLNTLTLLFLVAAFFNAMMAINFHRKVGRLQLALAAAQQSAAVAEGHLYDFSSLSPSEVTRIGQIFFSSKVSEILMGADVQDELGFNNDTWEQPQYIAGLALDLLSVERKERPPSPSTIELVVSRLVEHGIVVLPSVVEPALCRSAAEEAHAEIMMNPTAAFGRINQNVYRKDYPLPLGGNTYSEQVLISALEATHGVFAKLLGEDAELVEFSVLNSYPGAAEQSRHSDAGMDHAKDIHDWSLMYTAFVYLDDVAADQAALDVWPGTHTHYHFLQKEETAMMASAPSVRAVVRQGSILIYDSRTLHRGTANTSPLVRPTIYFSFKSRSGVSPDGPTYSLRREYTGLVDLASARRSHFPSSGGDGDSEATNGTLCRKAFGDVCGEGWVHLASGAECMERCWKKHEEKLASACFDSIAEQLCKANIYEPGFEARASWGVLRAGENPTTAAPVLGEL